MNFRLIPLFVVFVLYVGCSGRAIPTLPSNDLDKSNDSIDNIPVVGLSLSEDGTFDAVGMLGAYELRLDPSNTSAELISKRIPSIGESWIVNGISFFTISPCTSCLKVKSIALTSDSLLALTFAISHPFEPGDPLQPPTGKNRLDLDIFDLALVVRPLGVSTTMYPLIGKSAYVGVLANNAGYTVELANVLNDFAAMPYALVVDDNASGQNTFNKFAMGADAVFDVFFNLEGLTSFNFDLFLTMGYGASAKKAQRLSPKYFNPEFNRKPAWKVKVIPPEGTNPPAVGNTWNDGDTTTPYKVTVMVWDWQHGVTSIANPPVNPGDIAFASDVTQVSVEVPGMTSTLNAVTTPKSGTGSPSDPLIYEVSFPNKNKLSAGKYWGLVKVTDSRVPAANPLQDPIDYTIDVPMPGTLVNYAIPEFATYQSFTATVVVGSVPPTCDLVLSKTAVGSGETIMANPGTSSDPDGFIISYEYDTNYVGGNFTPDIVQTHGSPNFGQPVPITLPCNTSGSPMTVTIALRVCDNSSPQALCSTCSKDVTVGLKIGSPGNITITVNRGELGQHARLITSIDIDWPDNPCAQEFSIERNLNGWNVGSNPPNVWSQIDTCTTSNYKYILSGNDWDEDFRFRVIARAVPGGNPASDSEPSEEAFVWFQSNAGINANPQNTWISTTENNAIYFGTSWGYGPSMDSYGSGGWGEFCWGPVATNTWGVMRSPYPIPDLEGQCVAWIELYEQMCLSNWSPTMALAVGTLSQIPSNTPTLPDFNPSNNLYPNGYPYNASNVEGLNQEFGETNQAGWQFVPSYTIRYLAYYLNDLLDGPSGTRDWVAFGCANGSIDVTYITWDCFDAMAVVVY